MLKNYFKIAWRNILKNRFHAVINVSGLSIGIAFSLLIGAYVWGELQVNKHLKNADNQYIIQSKWKDPNMGYEMATLGPLAKELKEQYPALVANYYRFDGITSSVSKGDKHFRESLQICDTTMLNMYGFPLLYGDPKTAFKEPFSIVITEEKANKFFGKTSVAGQTLTIESFSGTKHDFMITGVLKNVTENSVQRVNSDNNNQFYIPESCLKFFGRDINQWRNLYVASYIELQKGVSPEALKKPIEQLIKANTPADISNNLQPYLVPLKEYYLNANNGLVKKMLYTVSLIACFILLMAIINFVNISISKSSSRIKEIGVRKVLGGMRKQLMTQFLIETIILVCIATFFALIIYSLANPFISDVLGKQIPKLLSFPLSFALLPAALILFIGLLAGIYPALVLSALKASDSLKGKLVSIKENILLRKSLVGFQFFTATIVFIGAIIVSKQVSLFFSKDLGYDKEFIVSAQLPRDWSAQGVQRMRTIRNEFASMSQISNVSLSYEVPNGANSGSIPFYVEGTDTTHTVATQSLTTDEQYAETYKIPLKAGSFFSSPYNANDSLKTVINETAAKAFGFSDANEAIGKKILAQGGQPITICGVTKDFHFGSMQQQIQPIAFINVDLGKIYRFLSFKLKPGNISATIEALQNKWSALLSGAPFEYTFMDDTLKKLYQSEIQLKKAAQAATAIAMIIVILGVVGLTSVSVQKRTKEIGIRKVLGAASFNIISLFLKEFVPVILIAGVISVPVAYYIMQGWLNDYTYRIPITALPFMISIIILGAITILLISFQIAKASAENPVKNLRTE